MLHDSGRSPPLGSNPDDDCSRVDSDLEALEAEDEDVDEEEEGGGAQGCAGGWGQGRRWNAS